VIGYALEHGPVTVRQLYYRVEVASVPGIDKTQGGYDKVQRQVLALRRLAVNPGQIQSLDLPRKPPKASDHRARSFNGQTVETEAMPIETMQEIVRMAIEALIDSRHLAGVEAAEEADRAFLHHLAELLAEAPI
jgi:hypothetical protein